MDTSEIYIKMCDCPEIQRQRPEMRTRIHLSGNIYLVSHENGGSFFYCHDILNEDSFGDMFVVDTKAIWLLRQDQIQDMMEPVLSIQSNYNHFVFHLAGFLREHPELMEVSMDQLTLCFYMDERHGKKWAGSEWVKK